ncbi:MAG: AzlD domain-containing protein [Phaeovulum sp.]|uniref:AzlD domain-containing protein n=1 Tax=Phaeovulum sp. TaxID=2934796 RepID=UPI00272FFAC3|nr:AzlD domain-containing protein [Phaeovulum sp.]MDP2064153.1 AzlD domain-containing protein [Phaeovulum sp.]
MKADLLALALIVGGCTWAFRYLPTRLDLSDQPPAGLRARFLAATGPAAIATLAAASLLPMVSARLAETLPLIAGLMGVVAIFGWRRSVVLATLGGAAIYGVACALV